MPTPLRTVVLGCAKQRRVDLGAVVEVLAGRGNAVEVVSGIEGNPLPWEQVVRRIGADAIYVVCGDDVLTLEKISGIRAALQRAKVPLKQVWAGPINWAEPVQVLRHADQLLRTANGAPTRSPSEASGRTVLPPPAPHAPPPSVLRPAPPSAPPPPASSAPRLPDDAPEVIVATDNKRRAVMFGTGALVVTAAILTAIAWPSGGEAAEPAPVTAASEAAPDPEPEPAAVADSRTAAATEQPTATPQPAEATPTPATDSPPSGEAAAVVPSGEAPAPLPAADAADAVPEDEPVVYAEDEDQRIDDALRNQSIRALDILLVSPEARVKRRRRTRTMWNRFPEAEAYCAALEIDGVTGWRLATAGELASLTTANMLTRSTYWSSTKGDSYGNTRIVWNVFRHRMNNASRRFRGARTVCVRDHV